MTRIVVLDPTAPAPVGDPDPGPDAGDLAGRRVGLRFDGTWRSFRWVLDEWEPVLADLGAHTVRWCAAGRVGEDGERTRRELEEFADGIDVAVVGLAN